MPKTENKFTETEVLAHFGVGGTGDTLIDNAREAGLIYACLGCGTVGGINPEGDFFPHLTMEDARWNTREALDPEWFCCPDADQIIY